MTIAQMRALLGLGDDVSDAAVVEAYAAYGADNAAVAYAKPTPAMMRIRYPALQAITDAVLQYWLTDAERNVDTSWAETDYAPGLMALAAHNLTVAGAGASSGVAIPAGVTSFRSGAFSVAFSDAAATQQAEGGYGSTAYGREFMELARKRSAGGFTTGGGMVACGGYRSSLLGWG